jgi:amidohydrolase
METKIDFDIQHLLPQLIQIRKELHQYPEVSGQEFYTTERIKKWLRDLDCHIHQYDVETGVIAEIQGDLPGPTVAFRADIDALPILEKTGLDYESNNMGVSHACGHDWHTTIALGAASVLAANKQHLNGNVRFIFQPAEETTQGAKQLIEAGLFEDGEIDAIFGLHNQPGIPAGKVGVTDQRLMAAVDTLKITIEGKSGHGAIPENTIDAVVAGSAVIMGLQSAVSRNIDPFEPVVITVGSFNSGTAHNVIAGKAELIGTVRSFNPAVRSELPNLINRITSEIAQGYGATATVEYIPQVGAIQNDPQMTAFVKQAVEEVLGVEAVIEPTPTMGGEDFALYQEYVPGCYFWVGTRDESKGIVKQWHDPAFLVNDEVIPSTVSIVTNTLLYALNHYKRSK